MKLEDFFGSWTGDGFGVRAHEAYVDDVPPCDFADDVAQSFAEADAPMKLGAGPIVRASCVVCGGSMDGRDSSTCSRVCASRLGREAPVVAGATFGALTAVRVVGSRNGSIWEFSCACGEKVERVGTAVRATARAGYSPACRSCVDARHLRVTKLSPTEVLSGAERNRNAWTKSLQRSA